MGASLACNFWFFYSFLNDGTIAQHQFELFGFNIYTLPFAAGLVGCGAQLFVYAFIGNLARLRGVFFKLLLCVVCVLTMGLTMVSTYSTLDSFLIAKTAETANSDFIAEQKKVLLESRAKDMQTLSVAATQAVNDKYRSQGKLTTESNEALRREQQTLLENMEKSESKVPSPLDSLIKLFGSNADLKPYFCAWLAVMFDLLPILGIAMLGKLEKQNLDYEREVEVGRYRNKTAKPNNSPMIKESSPPVEENTKGSGKIDKPLTTRQQPKVIINEPAPIQLNANDNIDRRTDSSVSASMLEGSTNSKEESGIYKYLTDKPLIYTKLQPTDKEKQIDDISIDILDPIIINALYSHEIQLSYAGVGEFTGLSKWKVQQFFSRATKCKQIINKSDWALAQGYIFTKSTRYHLNKDVSANRAAKTALSR